MHQAHKLPMLLLTCKSHSVLPETQSHLYTASCRRRAKPRFQTMHIQHTYQPLGGGHRHHHNAQTTSAAHPVCMLMRHLHSRRPTAATLIAMWAAGAADTLLLPLTRQYNTNCPAAVLRPPPRRCGGICDAYTSSTKTYTGGTHATLQSLPHRRDPCKAIPHSCCVRPKPAASQRGCVTTAACCSRGLLCLSPWHSGSTPSTGP